MGTRLSRYGHLSENLEVVHERYFFWIGTDMSDILKI